MIYKTSYPEPFRKTAARQFELIDTHCHLDCEPLFSQLPHVLTNARQAGVSSYVVPGVHPEGWSRILQLTGSEKGIYPAPGIHPMHADTADEINLAELEAMVSKCIAIGEIGLDPTYQVPPRTQEAAFREQLRIASKHGLPVLVHCRRLFLRTLQILQEEKTAQTGGIMHAFSGSVEMAKEFIKLGFAISVCGSVTWPNAVRPVRLAVELPLDSIVLETDSPDMTPQQFKGKPNQPAWLSQILFSIAEKRCMSPDDVAMAITANTKRHLHGIQ